MSDKMEVRKINKLQRLMFFSAMRITFKNMIRVKHPDSDVGKFLQLSFILTKDKTVQKVKFERYEGDSDLTEKQRDEFAKVISLDLKKELPTCKSMFIIFNIEKKTIFVQKNFTDKKPELINI